MRKKRHVIYGYVCKRCKTEFRRGVDAKVCESMSIPKPRFQIGDMVSGMVKEPGLSSSEVYSRRCGEIVEVTGPFPSGKFILYPYGRELLVTADQDIDPFRAEQNDLSKLFFSDEHIYCCHVRMEIGDEEKVLIFFEKDLVLEE